MRELNECKAEVFRRMEKGIKERKKRRNRILAACVPLCLCLVIVSITTLPGLFAPGHDMATPEGIPNTSGGTQPGGGKGDSPEMSGSVTDVELDDTNMGFVEWYGKNLTISLWETLDAAADNDYLNVYLIASVDIQDLSFSYQGKTLKEYCEDAEEKETLIEKLGTLLKVGDALKYGDAVYTTGTPTGEKWHKEFYDETVAYYGQDLLDKYIVDGEFLIDDVLADAEKAVSDAEVARTIYQKACAEYKKAQLSKVYQILKKQGINAGLSDTGSTLMILITKSEFKALDFNNMQAWIFTVKGTPGTDMNNDDLQIPQDDAQ